MYKDENHFVETTKVQPYVDTFSYDIFLDESVSSPEYYRSVITALNKANEGDKVNIFINSGGGLVSTATAIIHAMDRCSAKIVAHLVGDCCSAATMIALHADMWEISENVTFMVHTCSFGVFNSAEKIKDQHDFVQKQNRETMYREYTGLLTDEEIERCLDGKEFWFGATELTERLQRFAEHRQNKQSSALNPLYSAQEENVEKYEQILLDKLVESGDISAEERAIAEKVQKASLKLDEQLSDEEFDALMKGEHSPKEPISEKVTSVGEDDLPCFMIYDMNDVEYGIVSYEVLDGEPIRIELELLEDNSCFSINKTYLEDLPKSELKGILDNIGVRYAHNSGDKRLAEKVEEAITEYAKDHLEENIK